jgi:hypothetical protein
MRKFSLALIAVGAFLIVLAPMLKWYAYPRLAVAPVNQVSTTYLEAKDATIFDAGTLTEITTDLDIRVKTVGDANAPKEYPGSVTYVNTTLTSDSAGTMSADGKVRGEVERMTFDARTGEATPNVDGDFISDTEGDQTAVVHEGLVAKFPFETEKKTYDFWEASLKQAFPIEYRGTSEFQGLEVYEFHQTLEPTKTGTMDVPLSLLGLEGDETVTADQMYGVDRTLFVEPNTGVIIQRIEKVSSTLDYQGEPRVTLTDATVQYADKTIDKNVNEYGSQADLLKLVRTTVPQLALVLGLLGLVVGIGMSRRRAHASGSRKVESRDSVSV